MLDKERGYFSAHQPELQRQYPGKFVVIHVEQVAGVFQTQDEALEFGAREFRLQPFLVRNVNQASEVELSIPALTLGILQRANTQHTV